MDQNLRHVTDLALEQYRLNELPRAEAERVQRVLHGLPLRIEDAPLRGDVHPGEEARHQAAAQMRRAAS